MKNRVFVIIVSLILIVSALFYILEKNTKSHSPEAKANFSENGLNIEINYCRPYKKGRTIFSEPAEKVLQPYGKYWRMGANEATTFDCNKAIIINGQELSAGKYQIYAVPNKESWDILFNTEWDRWGATEASHKTDVLKTNISVNNEAPFEEQLLISFDKKDSTGNAFINIHWDKTLAKVPFTSK